MFIKNFEICRNNCTFLLISTYCFSRKNQIIVKCWFYGIHWADDFVLVSINYLVFLGLLVCVPEIQIIFYAVNSKIFSLKSWYKGCKSLVKRDNNEVDKSRLSLWNGCFVPVAEHTDRETELALDIPLLKEFFEEVIGPCLSHFKRTSLLWDITSVEGQF